jgi:hypothetical protein
MQIRSIPLRCEQPPPDSSSLGAATVLAGPQMQLGTVSGDERSTDEECGFQAVDLSG